MITVPLLQQQETEEQAGKTDNRSGFVLGAGLTPLLGPDPVAGSPAQGES